MKRSTVNEILLESKAFIRLHGLRLPPFAYWTPSMMKEYTSDDCRMIRDRMLGWDITDYGQCDYENLGLCLFTLRNGSYENVRMGEGMLYAEKLLISDVGQICPMHRHVLKTEDIINRGGGSLVLELFTASEDGSIDSDTEVRVLCDGRERRMPAGSRLKLSPGESVTLEPRVWHAFWSEGTKVLIGEVSNVNDDRTDNIFRDPIGRFSDIDEDAEPMHLLVSDYDNWLK